MSEDGEMWAKIREDGRIKRWSNDKQSIELLRHFKIPFKVLNASSSHYRVGEFDFWATTGKFYNQKTKETGRGVRNLIKKLSPPQTQK